MTRLARPFAALRPRPDRAQEVIAPPYDVVTSDEARVLAEGRPHSFLHISRPEIDFPPGTDPHDDAVYARGAENLRHLIEDGVLEREARASFYVYRMTMGTHCQTGVAMTASVRAYGEHRVRRHELTRPDTEDDRVRNIDSLNAQTGPVLCAYRAAPALDGLLAELAAVSPDIAADGQHAVAHSIWRIDDDEQVRALANEIEALDCLYIADGHHRSAAASRVAASRRAAGGAPDASHEYFLTVAFPHDQMQIFDYNRAVADLNGQSSTNFVAAVERDFEVRKLAAAAKPDRRGEFTMYLDGGWYLLRPHAAPSGDPVASLDISILQSGLIEPLLAISDPRIDPRIEFVGGVRGIEALERRVDSGQAAVAFALYPTGMEQLMAVADARSLMPPKSTWFEPKLADGLLSHVLD